MSDTINLKGLVATKPRHLVTAEGLPITSFRLASTDENGATNWYTIVTTGPLATNVNSSVLKGERVLLMGTLRLREWHNGDNAGMSIEVDASALGHDLNQGTTTLTRDNGDPADALTTVD